MMRGVMATALAVALGAASAGGAQAAVVLDLTQNACSSNCFARGVGSLGTVTVNAVNGGLDFTVDLSNGALFNAKGNGEHNALVFDLDKSGLTISNLSAGFAEPTEKSGKTAMINPGPFNEAGFGRDWTYAVDYAGSAKQGQTPNTLSFTVSDAAHNLTLNDVVAGDIYNGLKIYAAADVYANGTTGNVGANPYPTGAVPEPATWALMILGVGMLGGALRRRRAQGVLTSSDGIA